jgi:hypothetical protein
MNCVNLKKGSFWKRFLKKVLPRGMVANFKYAVSSWFVLFFPIDIFSMFIRFYASCFKFFMLL